MKIQTLLLIIFVGLIAGSFVFSGNRTNPPVEAEPAWSSPEAKTMFYQSCADCHSHETRWPWYSYVAPMSWSAIGHVNDGREKFNISTRDPGDAHESAEEVEEDHMPLREYLLLHPEARLSPEQKKKFIVELLATFGGEIGDEDE